MAAGQPKRTPAQQEDIDTYHGYLPASLLSPAELVAQTNRVQCAEQRRQDPELLSARIVAQIDTEKIKRPMTDAERLDWYASLDPDTRRELELQLAADSRRGCHWKSE